MNNYLKKQLKNRDKKLKYDFLPSMIEIIEKPANRMGFVIMYVIIALIATAICWACFTKLDIAVTATGTVNTEKELVTLNVVTAGTIKEVNVNDGDYVNQGDTICTLVSDVSEAALKENEYNLEVLNIQKNVYEEVYNKYKADDYSKIEIDTEVYGENKRFAEAIILENNIILENLESLSESEAVLEKSKQLLSVMQSLNTIEAKIESISADLQASQKDLENHSIVAPVSGIYYVQNKLYTGKSIAADDAIGYIMPEENSYVFTAYVSDEDIYQIDAGDVVKIKITAFDNTEYEYTDGEIVSVGNVPMNIENKGIAYVVNIKLNSIPEGIKTGMEGNIDIIVGTRTVMDYFLEPFKKGLKDSLKEK